LIYLNTAILHYADDDINRGKTDNALRRDVYPLAAHWAAASVQNPRMAWQVASVHDHLRRTAVDIRVAMLVMLVELDMPKEHVMVWFNGR
jgi:hypothetical protein